MRESWTALVREVRTWLTATRGRQAAFWSVVGMCGTALAALGILLLTEGSSSPPASGPLERPSSVTPNSQPSFSATATPSPTAVQRTPTVARTPSPSPTSAPTLAPTVGTDPRSVRDSPPPTPLAPSQLTGTPTPTPIPASARPFCPPGPTLPSTLFGLFTIGGEPAPAGTVLGLAFDGAVATSVSIAQSGGYRFDFAVGDDTCANRPGAVIGLVYDGVLYDTGLVVEAEPVPRRFDLHVP